MIARTSALISATFATIDAICIRTEKGSRYATR
jgi:hypothetical protein